MSTATQEKAPARASNTEPGKNQEHPQDTTEAAGGKPLCLPALGLYEKATATKQCADLTIEELIEAIRGDEFKEQITQMRAMLAAGDVGGYSVAKKDLMAVSISASVKGRRAKAAEEGRMTPTGFIQVDLDAGDNVGWTVDEMRDELIAIEHIQAVFVTPSGEGVKGLFRISPVPAGVDLVAQHKHAFAQVAKRFEEKNLTIDGACCDPVRLAFVSHDPRAWLREEEAPPMLIDPLPPQTDRRQQELPQPPAATSTAPRQGLIIRETGGHREITAEDVRAMLAAIPPRPEYSQWLRIASAVWDATDEATGTALLNAWSPEESPGEYAEKFSHRLTEVHAGTLVMLAKDNGWTPARRDWKQPEISGGNETAGESPAFAFVQADQLGGVSESMDFVEGLLTEGGASVVYGPSNCGKSFWIVDLGVSVASGTDFRDELEVEQGAVIYVALEGAHGARNRIAALKQAGRLKPDAPFFLIFEAVSLLEPGHADRLAETITMISDESGLKVRLVILDTMARAMAGGDENSGVDMTAAMKTIDAIRAATGAHVALVHHCGKDEAKGARGHSSLRAAVDTEIEVSRRDGETISTVRVTKQRDLQAGEAMPFSLEVVTLGTDRRGKPITSCIVHHEDSMMASKPKKTGRTATATPAELLKLLPMPRTKEWKEAAKDELGVGETAFHELLKRIKSEGGAVHSKTEGWSLPKVNFRSSNPLFH